MIAVDIREQLELCILYEYMIIDLDGQVRGRGMVSHLA